MKTININPELNINSYDDIVSKLEEYRKRYQELSKEFDSIKTSFFDSDKISKNQRKSSIKESLKILKDQFSYLDNILATLTTFDSKLLIPFVAEYLSKNTFERYLTIVARKDEYYGRTRNIEYYYFICNAEDVLAFQAYGFYPDKIFDYSIKENLTKNYISLKESSEYNLANADGLTSGFNNFPILTEAVRRIVAIRLSNPRIDDEECLNKALNGLLSNETTSKDIKPYNQTNVNGKKIKEMTLKEIFSSQRR